MYKLIKKCTNFRSLLFSQHLQSYSIYSRDMPCVKVKRTDSTHLCSKVYWHLNLDRSLRFVRIMKLFMNKFLTDPKPCINQCTVHSTGYNVQYTLFTAPPPQREMDNGVKNGSGNMALVPVFFKPVFRIRISFHADPDPKNVHMDPDPRR